jgi:hypothetical protein
LVMQPASIPFFPKSESLIFQVAPPPPSLTRSDEPPVNQDSNQSWNSSSAKSFSKCTLSERFNLSSAALSNRHSQIGQVVRFPHRLNPNRPRYRDSSFRSLVSDRLCNTKTEKRALTRFTPPFTVEEGAVKVAKTRFIDDRGSRRRSR